MRSLQTSVQHQEQGQEEQMCEAGAQHIIITPVSACQARASQPGTEWIRH